MSLPNKYGWERGSLAEPVNTAREQARRLRQRAKYLEKVRYFEVGTILHVSTDDGTGWRRDATP